MLFSFKANLKDSFFKLSRRTRTVVLITAGAVFLILFSLAIWRQYFADTLINYASSQTKAYVHFNLSKFKSVEGWNKTLQKVLEDNGLNDFDISLIDREAALLGQDDPDGFSWILLLKTNNGKRLEKILSEKNIKFKFLS
ncbi:MAG: hypothetical protein AAB791_03485, partial [Patescibacteria group bacterium]